MYGNMFHMCQGGMTGSEVLACCLLMFRGKVYSRYMVQWLCVVCIAHIKGNHVPVNLFKNLRIGKAGEHRLTIRH